MCSSIAVRQNDKGCCQLGRLCCPLQGYLLAEILHGILGNRRADKRCPDRPRRDAHSREMPFCASICATPPVKFWIGPLVVASRTGMGISELINVVLVTALPAFMCGTAAFVT
jgi:hypothetical protein